MELIHWRARLGVGGEEGRRCVDRGGSKAEPAEAEWEPGQLHFFLAKEATPRFVPRLSGAVGSKMAVGHWAVFTLIVRIAFNSCSLKSSGAAHLGSSRPAPFREEATRPRSLKKSRNLAGQMPNEWERPRPETTSLPNIGLDKGFQTKSWRFVPNWNTLSVTLSALAVPVIASITLASGGAILLLGLKLQKMSSTKALDLASPFWTPNRFVNSLATISDSV